VFDFLVILIPVLPLAAVLLNGLLGSRYSHDVAHRLAWGSVGLSFLCSIGVFVETFRMLGLFCVRLGNRLAASGNG
jgi:NADH-quinone oxidoreductase subunit L